MLCLDHRKYQGKKNVNENNFFMFSYTMKKMKYIYIYSYILKSFSLYIEELK